MSLEQELQQEKIINLDLSNFTSVEIGTSVKTTVEKMQAENHQCAIIVDRGPLVGIFTDHDILGKIVDNPETWHLPIDDFITLAPITVKANDPVSKALAVMDNNHFRNVPVVDDDGVVIGNLTHHAVIKYLTDRFPESVHEVKK